MSRIDGLHVRHLRLLEAIVRYRSVSEAARALDIPQPTASHGLAKLRQAFDDPLLVKTAEGMNPTPRARDLQADLQTLIALSDRLARDLTQTDPAMFSRTFVIIGSDLGQMIVLSTLHEASRREAPLVRFVGKRLASKDMVSALESGDADIAFGSYPRLAGGIHEQTLYTEHYLAFANPEHPFIRTGSVEDFMNSAHILVTTKGLAHAHRSIERSLLDMLPAGSIRAVSESFLAALASAAQSDLIAIAPGRQLQRFAQTAGLTWREPPIHFDGFPVKQYWHARSTDDPQHQWLRRTIQRTLQSRHGQR